MNCQASNIACNITSQCNLVLMNTAFPERIGDQLALLVKETGMNYDMLARAMSVSRRSVSLWLAGKEPERINRVRIKEFARLIAELCTIVKPEKLKDWWNKPVSNFGGSTPLQVLERGEMDRIWRMIWEVREGNSGD
jgi:hypothetical protein